MVCVLFQGHAPCPGSPWQAMACDTGSVRELFPGFGIGLETDALVGGFGFRMIPGVGVVPHAVRRMNSYRPQGPIQEIGSETTALNIGNQAKVLTPLPRQA